MTNCQRCGKPAEIAVTYQAANPRIQVNCCAKCAEIMDELGKPSPPKEREVAK